MDRDLLFWAVARSVIEGQVERALANAMPARRGDLSLPLGVTGAISDYDVRGWMARN